METRRRIALITTELENPYQQRIMKGVFSQAKKYDYDVAVFSTMVDITHFMKDNLTGEKNIYQLINFSLFDGVIITPSSLFALDDGSFREAMLRMFRERCRCKVVSLDSFFGDYENIDVDDERAFYEITRHICEVHGYRKICVLNGDASIGVSQRRLKGVLRYMKEHNIDLPAENIVTGDFWYPSGENLAEEIASGEREMPEAVICANDYMAIGLANRLKQHGIQVPGQIAVTGYDATSEAAINEIIISSYVPGISEAAARAVNCIRRAIQPELPCVEPDEDDETGFRRGESCGCAVDVKNWRNCFNNMVLHQKHNWSDANQNTPLDLGVLTESYMSECVTGVADYQQCFEKIYDYTYLLRPFGDFWLCLKENWLDLEDVVTEGYPERMRLVMHSNNDIDIHSAKVSGFCKEACPSSFDTANLLPHFLEGCEEASVYYFLPIHFREEMYGYIAIRCSLTQEYMFGKVHHNWIRIVSNGLAMTRIRNRLFELSMKDSVTGLFNRRGMGEWLHGKKTEKGNVLVIMADMDGLKYINDHYGHSDGDFSLIAVADSLKEVTEKNEISARIGGDEFLLVGVGSYDEESCQRKIEAIEKAVIKKAEAAGKKYEISASMGYALGEMSRHLDMDELIEQADMDMYRNKRRKHKNRK